MALVNAPVISKDLVAAKAKLETTYGVAETLAAADGVMMSNFKVNHIKPNFVDTDIVTGASGNSLKYNKFSLSEVSFDIELGNASSGTTPPAVGQFLTCTGWDEIIEADHVAYQLTNDVGQQNSIHIEVAMDDRVITMLGCRGSSKIVWMEDERLVASFSLIGLYNEPVSSAFARVDYSAFNRSAVINPDNITLCQQNGLDLVTHKFEFDTGAKAERLPAFNQKLIVHTDMTPSASSSIRLPKLANWNLEKDVHEGAVGLVQLALTNPDGVVELDCYQQYTGIDITDDTPRKANLTHNPVPDATTTGTVIRFKDPVT